MQGVLLAAGKGERMKPLTDLTPKVMLPIEGKPVLQWGVELMKENGITDICINLWYLPEKITEFFGNGEKFGVKISYSREARLLGEAGSVKKMIEDGLVNGRCVLINGDVIAKVNLRKMVEFHEKKGAIATILVHPSDHPYDSDLVKVDENYRVIGFPGRPKRGEKFQNLTNAGICVLEKEIAKFIPSDKPTDFGKHVFPEMIKKGEKVFGYYTLEYVKDMGTLERYKKVKKHVREGRTHI